MMNTFTKTLALALTVIGIASTESFAQTGTSATANATAVIVTPITITNTTALNFGNVAVNSTLGTAVLSAAATPVMTTTGGVTLPSAAGNARTAATFTVSGQPNYTYAVTLPSGTISLTGSVSGSMTVGLFTSNAPGGIGTIAGSGTHTLYVGATLNVAADQPSGNYAASSPFTVAVNYN